MKNVLLLVLIAFAAPLSAQSLDLTVELGVIAPGIENGGRVRANDVIEHHVMVRGDGPVRAQNVALDIDAPGELVSVFANGPETTCAEEKPIRCAITAPSGPFWWVLVVVRTKIADTGRYTSTARVTTTTPETDTANNADQQSFEVVTGPDLGLDILGQLQRVVPGEKFRIWIHVHNAATEPATNVRFTATPTNGGTLTGYARGIGANCAVTGDRMTCVADRLGHFQSAHAELEVMAPERTDGQDLTIRVAASSDVPDANPENDELTVDVGVVQVFTVEHTADAGAGSLRQAILDAANCRDELCLIRFRIAETLPEQGWFTIRPESPMPPLAGFVTLDATTQTAATGDTNPDGPEVELNGSLLEEGAGLVMTSGCEVQIRGLAVNGFPGHGIESRRAEHESRCHGLSRYPGAIIEKNYIGTDPRGRTAIPNLRGIFVDGVNATAIGDNLISGNRRAGVFVARAPYVAIGRNRIGIASDGTPLPNGNSGIYAAAPSDIFDNTIAHHPEWGIARTASEIQIQGNAIFGNRYPAIDFNLDFETENGDDSKIGRPPNKPVLASASYDPATNKTTVRGRLDSRRASFGGQYHIELFASASVGPNGFPQAERFLAKFTFEPKEFALEVEGDLTGQWITATATRTRVDGFLRGDRGQQALSHPSSLPGDTSELSNAVQVK